MRRTRKKRRLPRLLLPLIVLAFAGWVVIVRPFAPHAERNALASDASRPAGGAPSETVAAVEKPPATANVPKPPLAPVKVYYNGLAKDGKQVALTFDDGPDGVATPKILDILKANHIKATFFIVGKQAKAHPDMVRRIVKEGHAIGNHSWSHPDFGSLSTQDAKKQIEDTQDEIEAIAGVRPTLFRPPYGALNDDKKAAVRDLDMAIVDWSVDTRDWAGTTPPNILKLVNKELYPGGIILQHCAGEQEHLSNTIAALKQLIPALRKQGYAFVTVPKLLHLPDSQS
ncbi:polysaccharide deacetylase family protein [Paenibacillus glycinis]|nr:polysaccharide deacetylase family protein [Paenibacillus glycinis]